VPCNAAQRIGTGDVLTFLPELLTQGSIHVKGM
jgi:hypothetical protein